jgi:hypothetical protein
VKIFPTAADSNTQQVLKRRLLRTIRRDTAMNFTPLSTNILTTTAITALKIAYDECNDRSAKEHIITAFKAIVQLRHELETHDCRDNVPESDTAYDASEYCAAV